MPRREKRSHTNDLYQAILTLQSEEECIDFFKDVCSNNELLAMEQRYNVAKMLDDGKTYLDIQESTNASTATISRVGRALSEGTGVIGEVLKRQKEA
ncbi:MAG: TrpR YerC/YecD [Lachnospiraceae bacterium]|nr:TrpR YerC/YecD [Lachnospiraceae bacterium]MBQ2577627.1 TrpR YerC/YecD [Lachnospiraceae bacterium]MCR4732566.1 TrpR YerC/YecD [Lachnospiraceae bacterium]